MSLCVIKLSLALLVICSAARTQAGRIRERHEDDSTNEAEDALEPEDSKPHFDCCTREVKMKRVGLSVTTAEEIHVDIGRCRKHCNAPRKLHRTEFRRLMHENPDMDPRQLFLIHSERQRSTASCPNKTESCQPTSYRVERIPTIQGTVTVGVITACDCQPKVCFCQRKPKVTTLHKGTPLETTLDVGQCKGHCSQDLNCRPIKTKTKSIEGPNGAECISVVEACGCEPSCYRTSRYEHVYDYSLDGVATPKASVLDVGACVGECEPAPEDHCVLREEEGGCLMSLVKTSSRCAPTTVETLYVTERDGSNRTITSINSCGCQ
ncbi:uncharacterized protein LOC143031222 [Oratosquilla oratoria]|uniref:uncharacterized protein LOC143031222 n=1 Tax=Oratosquilla oratoria TaxID=337810 RepID=UPI003F75DAE0